MVFTSDGSRAFPHGNPVLGAPGKTFPTFHYAKVMLQLAQRILRFEAGLTPV
jgi:hypothetical protein